MSNPTPSHYVHGTDPEEQERLSLLNDILNAGSLRELELGGGEHILDLGCGLGQLSRAMAKAAGPGDEFGASIVARNSWPRRGAKAAILAGGIVSVGVRRLPGRGGGLWKGPHSVMWYAMAWAEGVSE